MNAKLVVNGDGVVDVTIGLIAMVATPGWILVTGTGHKIEVVIVAVVAGKGEHVTRVVSLTPVPVGKIKYGWRLFRAVAVAASACSSRGKFLSCNAYTTMSQFPERQRIL